MWSATIFLSSLEIFCPFTLLKARKNKTSKKWKKGLEISFYTKCTKNHDHMLYYFWDTARVGCNFSFWASFALLPSEQPQIIKISIKWKNAWRYHLHKCTKNHDHMLYCCWDMARDRYNYFSFWAIFWPFTRLTAPKNQNSKKWDIRLEISPFYKFVPKIMIRWCTVPEIWCATDGHARTDGKSDT